MRHPKILASSLIILAIVSLYIRFDQVQAQTTNGPYVPSSIPVSQLGETTPPGRLNIQFQPQDPVRAGEDIRQILEQAKAFPEDSTVSGQAVPAITTEIQTLATGLENDPLAIYDYVHDHIDFVPSWGLLKNPRETLLAGEGNAFEQAALLKALLDATGRVQTQYVWGDIRVDKTVAMNWVGATDPNVVGNIFASGGIPTTNEGSTLRLSHIWVEVIDQGNTHALDPSFKTYSKQSGQNLRPLMGYTLPAFVSQVELDATISTAYIQNLNQSAIQNNLDSYALNLVNHLRSNMPFIYLEDLIGGRQIVPITSTSYPTNPPYQVVTTSGQANTIPSGFAYDLTIELPGVNYTTRIDNIAGERITVFYECATAADCQTLANGGGVYNIEPAFQVNVVPRLRIGGAVVATGSSIPLGSWNQPLTVRIDTPSGDTFSFAQFLIAGEWYALPMRLQTVSTRALDRQRNLMNEAYSQGFGPDDERLLGQILHVLGLSYFNEVDLGDRIDSRLAEVVHIPHFSMMIASRGLQVFVNPAQPNLASALDPGSHSVDVRLNIDTAISAQNPANSNRERAWFYSAGIRGSAVEHAIVEQLQPVSAVSTIQILNVAAENGQPIYHITPANLASIIPLLNHTTNVLNSIINHVSAGRNVVISQDEVTLNQWTGSGWISYDPASGSAGYLISGNLGTIGTPAARIINGGSGSNPQPPGDSILLIDRSNTEDNKVPAQEGQISHVLSRSTNQNPTQVSNAVNSGSDNRDLTQISRELDQRQDPKRGQRADPKELSKKRTTGDPIDATTGDFLYQHQDIDSHGGRGAPLQFERFYVSSKHNFTNALGFGWNHTYNIRYRISSEWFRSYGGRMAMEAVQALVAAQVGLDLFDISSIPHQRFAMDVAADHWLMTQITNNAVTITEPDGHLVAYVRLIDGTYQPAAGRPNLSSFASNNAGIATFVWEDGWRMIFDAAGRLTHLYDPNGQQTSFSYNGLGLLSQVQDAVSRTLTFTYDSRGRLSQITDPLGRIFKYGYDGQGNLQTYTDPLNQITTYAYDSSHRIISITDPAGITFVSNQYDALGRVSLQTNGRGHQFSLIYGGERVIVTDPLGNRAIYLSDNRGRLLQVEDALGIKISSTYDAADHEIKRTDGLSQSTTLSYDAAGHLTRVTDPAGQTINWTYDSAGNLSSYADQLGQTWQMVYDGQHNLTTLTNPLGQTFTYSYNSQGQLIQLQDPAGVIVTYEYDSYGNLSCLKNSLNQASCWAYDQAGRVTSFTDATGQDTHFSYDTDNNLLKVTNPLNHETNYVYDVNGNLTGLTDANGHTSTYNFDQQFNLIGVTDPAGNSTSYGYDANDRLISITDANGHQSVYQRDAAGRVVTITDPLSRVLTFSYDDGDRLITFIRADNTSINYQYDPLGRLTDIDYPSGPDTNYSYDGTGNLTASSGNNWSASYTYDATGRLTMVNDNSRGLSLDYTYDSAGRRIGLKVIRSGTTLYDVAYTYDSAGRLATLLDQTGSSAGRTSFDFDPAGRLLQINDVSGGRTDYTYDAAGQVIQIKHVDNAGNEIASYGYTYDGAGNATNVTETTPTGLFTTAYTYDAMNRLVRETYPRYSIDYAYDAVGNLTQRSDPSGMLDYTYDAANQLQTKGGETFSYDLHGNLTTWQNAQGAYTISYNYENLMNGLTIPSGDNLTVTHDAFGRRLTVQGSTGTRAYIHDGIETVLEGDANLDQSTLVRYLYGGGALVGRHTPQLGWGAYHGDALENVRYVLDSNSQPLEAYHYEAYGPMAQPAGIDSNLYRFVGKRGVYQHDIPGWPGQLTTFRVLDSSSGRFSSQDPLSGDLLNPPSLVPYLYSLSNPLRYSDPLGLRPKVRAARITFPAFLKFLNPKNIQFLRPRLPQLSGLVGFARAILPQPNPKPVRQILNYLFLISDQLFDFSLSSKPNLGGASIQAAGPPQWNAIALHGSTYALNCTGGDQLLAGAFHTGLFRSSGVGHLIWNNIYPASVGELVSAGPTTHYAGTWREGVIKSSDGGNDWQAINTGLTANDVYAMAIDPATSSRLFAGTEMGLFVSSNGGSSWGRLGSSPPGRIVSELAFAGNTLLAVTDFGLYRSPDNGISWHKPTTGLPFARINHLLVEQSSGTVYAGTALGPFQSADGGDTWTALGAGLGNKDVRTLAFDPTAPNRLVAGTTQGLFVSTDGGNTWIIDTQGGLTGNASQVGALAFCPGGGNANLYLGVGGGVYALRTSNAPVSVTITGPITGSLTTPQAFAADVSPITTTIPLTYTWQATEQLPITASGILTHGINFVWTASGTKTITVTVSNKSGGPIIDTHKIVIEADGAASVYLPIVVKSD